MDKVLTLLLFLASLDTFSQTADYSADRIAPALKSRASAVIREMTTTVDMRTPENVVISIRKVITVLNKNGDSRATLYLPYNKNTAIKSVKGLKYDASGNINGKFSLNDFRDESAVSNSALFEDDRIKRYSPAALSYPYTISYEYEIRNRQNLIIPDWYATPASDMSVENSIYTFISKPADEVRIKAYHFSGAATEEKEDKMLRRTWRVSNLPAIRLEPYAPDADDFLTRIKIAAVQFSYYGHKGSYTNWKELGKWIWEDLLKSQQTLSEPVITAIRNLVKDATSDLEKARRIYEYMQKKTRYISVQVGIGGFRPFPAMDVQRLSYGDCKALVNYTQSLLKAAGIASEYCVVASGSRKRSLDADFASMDQGDHVILCVPLEKDTVWLECTSQEIPFGFLGDFTDDRLVLSCTESGGKLLRTPALTTAGNLLRRKAILSLDKEGNVRGKLQTELSGSQYDDYSYIIHKPLAEQLKLLKEAYDIDNIDLSNLKLSQKTDTLPQITELLELSIGNYVPRTGNRMYLIPNAFNKLGTIPEVRNRVQQVYLNRGYTDEDEVVYQLPEGYEIEAKAADQSITSDFGRYQFSIRQDGRKLIYSRKLVFNSGIYPAAKYAELSSFFSQISGYDHTKVVLKAN